MISYNKAASTVSLIAALVLLLSTASQAASVTYICVEQRALGWEPQSDNEYCCQFKPNEKRFFVKYIEGVFGTDTELLVLPKIEVTEGEETYQYDSMACDVLFRSRVQFGNVQDRKGLMDSCMKRARSSFGSNGIVWSFSPRITSTPKSMNYTSSQNVLPDRAYLSSGSCVKADE